MPPAPQQVDVRCPHCGSVKYCDPPAMQRWLAAEGRLKRAKDPDPTLVAELFQNSLGVLRCPECQGPGLLATPAAETTVDWNLAPRCEGCQTPLDPERLEIFPNTRLCPACQQREEQGETGEADYCPRCGAVLSLRQATVGVARYRLACGDCGWRG